MTVAAQPRALQRLDNVIHPRTSPWRSRWHRIARRRSLVVAGVLATVVTAVTLNMLQDDRYRAESTLLLQRPPIDAPVEEPGGADEPTEASAWLDRELGVVEGATVRSLALSRLGLDDAPAARATRGRAADVIVVRVDADTAVGAARLANAYAAAYIEIRSTDGPLRVEVLAAAEPPSAPIGPDRLAVLLTALAAGLALGLVGAIVADRLDDRFHDVDDLRRVPGVGPILAAVPAVPVDPTAGRSPLAMNRSSDPATAAYRLLSRQILASEPSCRVVAVTSVSPGGGASTTAAHLGVAFAESGSVIVVDADLGHPMIHRIFGVDGSRGLVENLSGEALDMTLLPIDERLSVLAAGASPPDPAAPLDASSLDQLVRELRRRAAFVVIGIPRLDTGPETAMLARMVDGVVVVVDLQHGGVRETRRSVTALAHTKLPVLGWVANRARPA